MGYIVNWIVYLYLKLGMAYVNLLEGIILLLCVVTLVILFRRPDRFLVHPQPNLPTKIEYKSNCSFGGCAGEDIFIFIKKIDIESKLNSFSDHELIKYVISCLHDNAEAWFMYMNFDIELLTWHELRTHLIKHYGGEFNSLENAQQLLNLNFKVGDDFEKFSWSFWNKYKRWRPGASEYEIVQALLRRLPLSIRCYFVNSCNQGLRDIIQSYRLVQDASGDIINNSDVQMPPVSNSSPRQPFYRPNYHQPQGVQPRRPIECYRCGRLGHIAANCRAGSMGNGNQGQQ